MTSFTRPPAPSPLRVSSSLGHAGAANVSTMSKPSGPLSTTTLPPGPESRVRFSPSCCALIGTAPTCARNAASRSCGCCAKISSRGISASITAPAPSAAIILSHSRRDSLFVRLTVHLSGVADKYDGLIRPWGRSRSAPSKLGECPDHAPDLVGVVGAEVQFPHARLTHESRDVVACDAAARQDQGPAAGLQHE